MGKDVEFLANAGYLWVYERSAAADTKLYGARRTPLTRATLVRDNGAVTRTATDTSPQLVIFDLDGTLTDSAQGIVASFRHALAAVGAEVPAWATWPAGSWGRR